MYAHQGNPPLIILHILRQNIAKYAKLSRVAGHVDSQVTCRRGREGGEARWQGGVGHGQRRYAVYGWWASKERRDGTRRKTRGKKEQSGAEMGKKRGGDGKKGEEAKEERAKKGDTREGVSEWIWKAQQHGLVSAPQAEQVVRPRQRLNRGANVEGRVRCGRGACESPREQEQWHRILRLGRWQRCGVGVQAAAYAEGTDNEAVGRAIVLEGDEARDLLGMCRACVLETDLATSALGEREDGSVQLKWREQSYTLRRLRTGSKTEGAQGQMAERWWEKGKTRWDQNRPPLTRHGLASVFQSLGRSELMARITYSLGPGQSDM
ncbi:hypothetical protein DFH08DRAFT_819784 [Mycena albidolilacea]|uniref:Uncharacterized protein n=1 Tax=Mycena albidolilacea TaxID=1033008 RepID=A0AAD7EF63_9AGAR|nr:hypothetical protein DFH08DRAFT_819784 [Mycena albidolilacea]